MVVTHERSPSPATETPPALLKRMKMSHISDSEAAGSSSNSADQSASSSKTAAASGSSSGSVSKASADPTPYFAPELLHPNNIHRLNSEYGASGPFKHAVVEKLFQDELLKSVKDEILSELSFSEKETDIYKVNQTGDLASLSYLNESQLALLPNLLTLRDALYSQKFREFVRAVTGCGPLSGTKQDMSVNTYTKGCHLLNHDDVIGSRRVSYILYMPLPHYQGWQKEWGGALELYPTKPGPDGVLEPEAIPSKTVPPSWNQFIFFEVQPGKSFHSVEEVVVGEGEDGRQRLSISGWFHSAQQGEPGYEPEIHPAQSKSSREQLAATSTDFKSYPENIDPPLPEEPLTPEHISFLSEFLNPVYLQPRTLKALSSKFVEESSLELHSFLSEPIAQKLSLGLAESDMADGLGPDRETPIPPHSAGAGGAWALRGPPHKWRYSVLKSQEQNENTETTSSFPVSAHPSPDTILRSLQENLFPSTAFRAWLANVSQLLPLRFSAEARRFRPGLDYTLATSEEKEARLDVVLGLTPQAGGIDADAEPVGWETGEWGGWECYMAPHDEEDDPAVYRSGSSKKASNGSNGANGKASPSKDTNGDQHMSDEEDEAEDEDDGTLLTVQPGFNRLLLVLRDEGVMRFVKYVSAAAQGSRWDICGEYEVGAVQQEDD